MSIRIKIFTLNNQSGNAGFTLCQVTHMFWLFYKGHRKSEIPSLLYVLHIPNNVRSTETERTSGLSEVYISSNRMLAE